MPGVALAPAAEIDDGAPWHDPAMPLVDRMKLAEGKPLPRRMMAAMAQQDCGQCGYNCKDYSEAIFAKKEGRLEPVRAGRQGNRPHAQGALPRARNAGCRAAGRKDCARAAGQARLFARQSGRRDARAAPPSQQGRARRKRHGTSSSISQGTELAYEVGDSLGIFPVNDPGLVDAVIAALGAPPDFPIGGRTLRETLSDGVSLSPAPDMLFQLISYLTGGDRRKTAKAIASGQDPDGDAATLDVLAALQKFAGIRPDPEAFIEALDPLQPRVYSISSSPKMNAGRVSLTVDAVRYEINERTRLGVASTFLAGRIEPGAKGARLCAEGTALRTTGRSEQADHHDRARHRHRAVPRVSAGAARDQTPLARTGSISVTSAATTISSTRTSSRLCASRAISARLTLAWSRDGDEKIYVQHRMRDDGRDLWAWLERGAHIYVCGDALRMAKDVERALIDVVAAHGKRSPEDAARYVAELKRNDRYQLDVY